MDQDFYTIKLSWLLKMRWWAAFGQSLVIGLVFWGAKIQLPLLPMFLVVSTTLISNILGGFLLKHLHRKSTENLIRVILILDVVLLSCLLFYTGGARNPFHYLYIIHVTLAALVLRTDWAWLVGLLSGILLGLLYIFYEPLPLQDLWVRDVLMPIGAWSAFFVASGFTAFFVSRLSNALSDQERMVSELRERELTREKLASLATLSAGAAHELANPLATIAVAAKELALRFSKSENYSSQEREDVALIRDEVAQCQEILSLMSGASGNVAGESMESFSIAELLTQSLEAFHDRFPMTCEFESDMHAFMCVGPKKALEQSLKSILSNAIQASQNSKSPIRVCANIQDGFVVIDVIDGGEGMSSDVLKKVGEPFFTTKPTGKGMGLGLFLTKTVIDSLGGTLTFHSEVGEGTTVTLKLPAKHYKEMSHV